MIVQNVPNRVGAEDWHNAIPIWLSLVHDLTRYGPINKRFYHLLKEKEREKKKSS